MLSLFDHSGRRVILAALGALVGLMPLAILPAYLGALVSHGNYTASEAGLICSLNLLGNALGVMWISWKPRLPLLPVLLVGLLLELSADLLSSVLEPGNGLPFLRFLAGIGGGLFTGIGFNIIASSNKTDQGFGFLILLQFLLGALLLNGFTALLDKFAVNAIYYVLAVSAIFCMLCMLFLWKQEKNDQPLSTLSRVQLSESNQKESKSPSINKLQAFLALSAIVCFEIAASGVWAYAEQIAISWKISPADIGSALAWGALAGIPGSLIVVMQGDRFGRLWPVTISVVIAALSVHVLADQAGSYFIFLCSMLIFNFFWAYAIPYMQAEQATLDERGQLATLGMSAVLLAIAYGPYLFSILITNNSFAVAIWICLCLLLLCAVFTLLLAYSKRKTIV